VEDEEDAEDSSPGGADVMMLAVPNLAYNNSNQGNDMHEQERALLLSRLMTPLRQSNVTPLSFVSIQLEKVLLSVYVLHFILFGDLLL